MLLINSLINCLIDFTTGSTERPHEGFLEEAVRLIQVLDYNPILGSFLIGSCIIFMTFVVLNLFISVILVAFSDEQKHHQASEEEEIVDLMLMKLFSFFGIKCKKEEPPVTNDQPEQPASN